MSGLTEQDKKILKGMFYPILEKLGNGIRDISEKQAKSNERLVKLETMTDTFEKLLERECTDREKEDKEIKENYLDRFKTVFEKLDTLIKIVLPIKTIFTNPPKPTDSPMTEKKKMRYRYVKLIFGLIGTAIGGGTLGAIIMKIIGG